MDKPKKERRNAEAFRSPGYRNLGRRKDDRTTLGVTFAFIATFCFALQGIIVKLAYAEETSQIAILFWRKVVFLPFFWAISLWKVPHQKIFINRRDIFFSMAVGGVGYFLVPMMSLKALTLIDAGIERILLFTYPIMVILINAVIERRLPPAKYIVVFFLMQGGTFFLIGGMEKDIFEQNIQGAGLILTAALIQALFVIITQTLIRRIGTIPFMLWALTGAFFVVLIDVASDWQDANLEVSDRQMMIITLISLMSFPAAILFTEGVKRIGSSQASLINSSAPLITVIFGYLILAEILQPTQIIGMLIILSGIVIMQGSAIKLFFTANKPKKPNRLERRSRTRSLGS